MAAAKTPTVKRRDVERALAAVLKSEQFASSAQLSDFLSFIVTKTLDKKSAEIKAYTIAVDALGRDEDFDPQTNAAVRVAAGRLRQTLALYNAQDAMASAPLKIVLAPGSYVPTFEPQTPAIDPWTSAVESYVFDTDIANEEVVDVAVDKNIPPSKTHDTAQSEVLSHKKPSWLFPALAVFSLVIGSLLWINGLGNKEDKKVSKPTASNKTSFTDANLRPRITSTFLLPDAPYPEWYNAGEVSDAIEVTMARFDDFQFSGAITSATFPLNDQRNADYHLLITARRRAETVRMFGKLLRESDGTVIWTTEQLFLKPAVLSDRNVPGLTGVFFSPLLSPDGVVFSDLFKTNARENKQTGIGKNKFGCIVAGLKYLDEKTLAKHTAARKCYEQLVKGGSHLSSVHASLSVLYLDEYLEDFPPTTSDPLEIADKMALKALQLSPQSARAHQVQFKVHKVRGHHQSAKDAALKALSLNPYDATIIGDYAAWLISLGELEEGKSLLLKAEGLLDAQSAQLEAYKFIALELLNQPKQADEIAAHMNLNRSTLTAFSVAISAHRAGNSRLRKRAVEHLARNAPAFSKSPIANFIKRGFAPDVAQLLSEKMIIVQKSVAAANQN
ncbi:MAG: hypothetical protein V3V02_12155 [Rhizobiaceae bacterium]